MDKPIIKNKRYSVESYHGSVENNIAINNKKQPLRTKSEYFEFRPEDQLYSYALETDGSSGTLSTYAEGRIGHADIYDNNKNDNRNMRKDDVAGAKTLTSRANTEYRYKGKTANLKILSNRCAQSEKSGITKRYEPSERARNGSISLVDNIIASDRPPASGQNGGLGDSNKSTSTTYDKIIEFDIGLKNDVGRNSNIGTHRLQSETHKSKGGNGSCSRCRIVMAFVVLLGLLVAAGVLIYIFIFMKDQSKACEELPTVGNGSVNRTTEDKATITCIQGFVPVGNTSISCQNGEWIGIPTCKQVVCGPYPLVENGFVNGPSERIVGSEATITCSPGFLVHGPCTISCLKNGSWSPAPACREDNCGLYTIPDDMVAVDDVVCNNTKLCLRCKNGLSFVNNSDRCVSCDNGDWLGSPKCEIPGTIVFDPTEEVYLTSEPFSVRCVLQNSSEWLSIIIVKSYFNGTVIEPLFEFTNNSGDIQVQKLTENSRFSGRHEPTQDGAAVICEVEQSQCEDSGVYICGNIVGAYTSPIRVKYTNTTVHITDTESGVPKIVVPDTVYDGMETTITCTAELGKDVNDTVLGELVMQIKYKGAVSFNNISSFKNNSLMENCRIKESVVSTVIPGPGMHDAIIRCIVLVNNETNVSSKEVPLNIVAPLVNISSWPSVFNFGETASLMCAMDFIDDWDLIEVRRRCNDDKEIIARIDLNSDDRLFVYDGHVLLTFSDLPTNSVKFELRLEPVQCSDACGSAGVVEYEVAVRINNSTWIQNFTDIKFQRQPGIPTLETVFDVIEGKIASFKCIGEVGEPKGYLEIESKFEGSNFTTFLSNRDGYDDNGSASITSAFDVSGECSSIRTIIFQINSATSKYHNKRLKCVSKPSPSLQNGNEAESEAEIIKIIPDNFCSEPEGFTGVLRHPFNCSKFVQCHSGQVAGVPAGCAQDDCFHETTCYPCEQIGGCSITDIFIDNFEDMIQLGDSVTLICEVQDFQGLADIVIDRGTNNSIISSFLNGDNNSGFSRVTEDSYISGNHGQLKLYMATAQCENGGTYRCVPRGSGKHSEDEITLMLTDADGRSIC